MKQTIQFLTGLGLCGVAICAPAGDQVVKGPDAPAEVLYELPPPPVPDEASPAQAPVFNPAQSTPSKPLAGPTVDVAMLTGGEAFNAVSRPGERALDRDEIDQIIASASRNQPRNATLETMLYDQLRAALPQSSDGSDGVIIEKAILPQSMDLPASGWTVRYDFRMPNRGLGQTTFQAQVVDTNGTLLKRFSGSVSIDREARGMQVTRMVRKGETIQTGDISEMATRLSELPRGSLIDAAAVVGNVARAELRPGAWLTDAMVQLPKVVQRGQAVSMRLSRGALKITAPAVARAPGSVGEVIEVRNAQSGKDLYARVISKDEVEVIF